MKEITAALVKLQSELKPAKYDSENPHFKAKYASLTSIIEASRELLAKNGLAITQVLWTSENKDETHLVTRLMHVSGESIESVMKIEPTQNTPQAFGSALTYARRYSWSSIIGLSTDEDDDGNAGSSGSAPAKKPAKKEEPKEKVITVEMKKVMSSLLFDAAQLGMVEDPNAPLPTDYDTFVAMGKDLRQMLEEAKKQ